MQKTEKDRLPNRVLAVINRCRNGEKLCKSLRLKDSGETEITFLFEPSGRRAPVKSSIDAIKSGYLRPAGDGLLGAESSQTFVAAE